MQARGTADFFGLPADADVAETVRQGRLDAPERPATGPTGRLEVTIDDEAVPGVLVVDLPGSRTETVDDGQGRRWGSTTYDRARIEREVGGDDDRLFEWRKAVEEGKADEARKELVVTSLDAGGRARLRWRFSNAWPVELDPPELDSTTDGTAATESVTVDFDAVERLAGSVRPSPLRTGVFRFVETANGGRISNGGALLVASDAGAERVTLDHFESAPAVDGERVRLLVPEGARSSGANGATALWVLSGSDLPDGGGTMHVPSNPSEQGMYWVPGTDFFHDREWYPASGNDDGESSRRSVPGWGNDRRDGVRVLVLTGGSTFEDAFGVPAGTSDDREIDVSPARAGEEITPEETVFAVVDDAIPPIEAGPFRVAGDGPGEVSALFDAGSPAPLAGATFGLATFSTPDASIAGQSVNPLVGMGTADLLQHEAARRVLELAGVTDADTVEWLSGPREITDEFDERAMRLVGTETTVRSFEGTVGGEAGPWLVGVHVGRATPGDHVVAAGVHRYPVGTVDGAGAAVDGWQRALSRGRTFAVETGAQLEFL